MKPLALALALCLAAVAGWSSPAVAVDDTKPVFNNCGKFGKDSNSDASDQVGGNIPEAEIVNAFVKHEPAKGADATTLNITIKNLSGTVPPPATSITYDAIFGGVVADTTSMVRAYIDFAGMVVFEYGHTEPLAGASTRYAVDGPTQGKLFTGADGVVQVVIPAEGGGKAGTNLTAITAETQVGRTTVVPGAVSQSPSRGLSFQNDNATIGTWKVEPCAAGGTTPPGTTPPGTTPPGTTPPGTAPPGTTPPTTSTQSGALPVKLLTKSLKKASKGKKVGLKLKASEPLKSVALRLSKGKAVFGSAKAASLSGTKTLKVKLSKKLGKGTYDLAVAGTDAKGGRRLGTFKVKVK